MGIRTRFSRFLYHQSTQNPRFWRRHPPGATIVAVGTQSLRGNPRSSFVYQVCLHFDHSGVNVSLIHQCSKIKLMFRRLVHIYFNIYFTIKLKHQVKEGKEISTIISIHSRQYPSWALPCCEKTRWSCHRCLLEGD